MRQYLKICLNFISQLVVLPFVIPCKLEEWFISRNAETVFHICTNLMALLPGLLGVFFRRAFYSLTLEKCSMHCHIGFGSFFSHRDVTIENHVYIGSYSMFGSCHLGENCLIGSRVSILSGKESHVLDNNGLWSAFSTARMTKVTLVRNVWVGEGAIIMADVGENSLVGAGSVITSRVGANEVVAGNPARFIRHIKQDGNE